MNDHTRFKTEKKKQIICSASMCVTNEISGTLALQSYRKFSANIATSIHRIFDEIKARANVHISN